VADTTGSDGELYVVRILTVEHERRKKNLRTLRRESPQRREARITGPESLDVRSDFGKDCRFGRFLPKTMAGKPDDVLDSSFALAEEQGVDKTFSYLVFFDLDEGTCGHHARSSEE